MGPIFSALFASSWFWRAPWLIGLALLTFIAYIYYRRDRGGDLRITIRRTGFWFLVVGFIYAVFLTFAQYYIWIRNPFTKQFLNIGADPGSLPRLDSISSLFSGKLGYFYLYTLSRIWMPLILSFISAAIFYFFLRFLRRRKERFFEDGEVELGGLAALLSGWPNFVIFLPLVFIFVIGVSAYRSIFQKERYTTMGWPFLLAALTCAILGSYFAGAFGLWVLTA